MRFISETRLPPRATVPEFILQSLVSLDVKLIFTVPGGPLMPFLRTCKRSAYRVIIARHETAACIMAASYFHDTGVPAAVALTSGPGAANATNGVLHALREQAALFVISARPASQKAARGAVQDLDSARFFAPITKRSEQLLEPRQLEFMVRDLVALAKAPSPGPVNLTVCCDHWDLSVGGEP
ncbi:MAG TPA: thiamine pyrophosphate-binding protein [Polyangiaceae bacterium]|nr:thiamine pyrophosphate-binding protein [Polyangiaceae bacterium]